MGNLFDTALPVYIHGDRFHLTARMVDALKLPKNCACGKLLTWDYMGVIVAGEVIEVDRSDHVHVKVSTSMKWNESSNSWVVYGHDLHRIQSLIHRSLKPGPGSMLEPAICPCATEHRNQWDMVFAGCEPLIDRWDNWIRVKNV